MQTEPRRSFKGVWIPREVWLNKELSWREKCLLAEIDSLDTPEEGCIASNQYLATMFNTTPGTIAVDLCRLRKIGLIEENSRSKNRVLRVAKSYREHLAPAKCSGSGHLAPANSIIKPLLNDGGGAILKEVLVETNGAGAPVELPGIKPPVPLKRQLTDGWCEEWPKHHPGCGPYSFQGAKDGRAADQLLKTGLEPAKILALAVEAWKRPTDFNCKQAVTLAGFAARFNDIRAELAPKPVPTIKPPVPTQRIVNGNY